MHCHEVTDVIHMQVTCKNLRVLKKRFAFAAWMFSEAGFSREQAEIRGRMMVTYMMGESTLFPDSMAQRKEFIKLKHAILTAPEQ